MRRNNTMTIEYIRARLILPHDCIARGTVQIIVYNKYAPAYFEVYIITDIRVTWAFFLRGENCKTHVLFDTQKNVLYFLKSS